MTATPLSVRPTHRLPLTILGMLIGALFLASCGESAGVDAADLTPPKLDLETLEGQSEQLGSFGTAKRAENSYVGLIEEGRAIGIAPLDELAYPQAANRSDTLLVQVYDRDRTAVVAGQPDGEGAATLKSDVGDFDVTVELEMADDAVFGTVAFAGEEAMPFTAEAANGISGFYSSFGSDENPDVGANWVVLPDGRQWGFTLCFGRYFYSPICGGHLN